MNNQEKYKLGQDALECAKRSLKLSETIDMDEEYWRKSFLTWIDHVITWGKSIQRKV